MILILESEGDPDRKEARLHHSVHHSQGLSVHRDSLYGYEAHSTILSTHILWLREHNRIASQMAAAVKQKALAYLADPLALDEFVFQVNENIYHVFQEIAS